MEISDADWADLIARTRRAALYGVVTTGIYCRYGCPSPAPLRRNVRAFDTVQ
jgi:AraC family transcriptional regulator of adaptative response/methylated-DNA-[protein]-cysteine methyltransferase